MADPGFPVGGMDSLGGHGPPMGALFGENEKIGSRRGGVRRYAPVDPPMPMISTHAKTWVKFLNL